MGGGGGGVMYTYANICRSMYVGLTLPSFSFFLGKRVTMYLLLFEKKNRQYRRRIVYLLMAFF